MRNWPFKSLAKLFSGYSGRLWTPIEFNKIAQDYISSVYYVCYESVKILSKPDGKSKPLEVCLESCGGQQE